MEGWLKVSKHKRKKERKKLAVPQPAKDSGHSLSSTCQQHSYHCTETHAATCQYVYELTLQSHASAKLTIHGLKANTGIQ